MQRRTRKMLRKGITKSLLALGDSEMRTINMRDHISLSMGTISGTLLGIISNIFTQDILKTAILAVVGALVSFIVSLVLKRLSRPKKKSGF